MTPLTIPIAIAAGLGMLVGMGLGWIFWGPSKPPKSGIRLDILGIPDVPNGSFSQTIQCKVTSIDPSNPKWKLGGRWILLSVQGTDAPYDKARIMKISDGNTAMTAPAGGPARVYKVTTSDGGLVDLVVEPDGVGTIMVSAVDIASQESANPMFFKSY